MTGHERTAASPFHQPKGVWAVALACVVSFMGIGLVDPILPALSGQLKASPSEVELLFTSYLVVTAVAMLVTGWVSSRIGGKRTLVAGLAVIVVLAPWPVLRTPSAGSSVPGRLGTRQRPVHRHLAGGDHRSRLRRLLRRHHSLRDRPRGRYRPGPAGRRRAGRDQLAPPVLRGHRPHVHRAGGHPAFRPTHPPTDPAHLDRRPSRPCDTEAWLP
jgi:hypothetical protein